MDILFDICIAISFGAIFGGIVGVLTQEVRKRRYTEQKIAKAKKLWKIGSQIMVYFTCLVLILGFIWCVYFLILGAVYPGQSDYASNMSEMIVAVLTVVSIAFAFYEFIRRK